MKLVIDTNILFSFFWENSTTKKLLVASGITLISPEMAIEELKKYSKEIMKKTKISKKEFGEKLEKLKLIVKFIPTKEYHSNMKIAEKISPDKNDTNFFALSLIKDCPLWSNDKILKNQEKVLVISTDELIEIIFE